jgi:hypothetical protein
MRPVALIALLACSGCATTTLRSGEAPGKTAPGYDERWHPAFLFGTVRGKERYDLPRLCPAGWAEIRVAADPFTVMAGVLTLFIYSPSRVTIVCTRQAGDEDLSF